MRPQDLYPELGARVAALRTQTEELAFVLLDVETWDPEKIRVDAQSGWSTQETVESLITDLLRTEQSLRAATGNLESAWAALGRLSME